MINVLVPTYNRPDMLEESIACFLAQDTTDAKMIILNDCAEQTLTCNYPRVEIHNLKTRFPTIGDKRNALLDLADGDLLTFWDDDDLYLSNHLSLSLHMMPLFKKPGFMKHSRSWIWTGHAKFRFWQDPEIHTALFRRDLLPKLGRFESIDIYQDSHFMHNALAKGYCYGPPQLEHPCTFIYRDTKDRYRASESAALDMAPVTPGKRKLVPHFKHDYEQMAKDTIDA